MTVLRRQPYKPRQEGAPQETAEMPSTRNSSRQTGAMRGTDETTGRSQDVERSGMAGTRTRPAADRSTGDPGLTPGKVEGVEDPQEAGNQ